ncbi:8218_t:CDS:10 [Paraglomus occultum]|uniref:Glutathione hydrolase n=1 Tax=Paraglomus occultum TaxID=144539 RepID=A0A9N8ZP78_9GLOM|nr:8218_t:CDS:10 [Paraglomus occultum]
MDPDSSSEDDSLPMTMVRLSTPTLEEGRPADDATDRTGLLVSSAPSSDSRPVNRHRSSRRRDTWRKGQKKVNTGARLYAVWFLIIFLVILFALVGLRDVKQKTQPIKPVGLIIAKNGAVASEEIHCSNIGVDILKAGGSAVDAAIASQLCIGSINSFSAGIGGGGFMIIRGTDGKTEVIDFRETAAGAANKTMYSKQPELAKYGGLSVGVPGEIRGFELAHKKFGKLPWKSLFEPSIKMNRDGFTVPPELARRIQIFKELLKKDEGLAELYMPNGTLLVEGDLLKRENLADTLELIATEGADVFYNGSIANALVDKIQQEGGILTLEDFASYNPIVREPVVGYYHGRKISTAPAPASGPALINILNILEGYELKVDGPTQVNVHRIVEALKYGFARRTELGDPDFVNNTANMAEMLTKDFASLQRGNISDDTTFDPEYYNPRFDVQETHGTTHVSVMDKDGQAIALTSTVNLVFGSLVLDQKTGILLNDEMDDFSIPGTPNFFGLYPSPFNYVAPAKRPLSSSVPAIIENNGEVEMVLGASGGAKIITATLQAIINVYDFNMNILKAIDAPRVHHQLLPNQVIIESGYPQELIEGLVLRGHNVTVVDISQGMSEVQAVMRFKDGLLNAASDFRKNGMAAGY